MARNASSKPAIPQSAADLHELGLKARIELIRYLSTLARHIDNELFIEMSKHGVPPGKLSAMARTSVDKDLKKQLRTCRQSLPKGRITEVEAPLTAAAESTIAAVKERFEGYEDASTKQRAASLVDAKSRAAVAIDLIQATIEQIGIDLASADTLTSAPYEAPAAETNPIRGKLHQLSAA